MQHLRLYYHCIGHVSSWRTKPDATDYNAPRNSHSFTQSTNEAVCIGINEIEELLRCDHFRCVYCAHSEIRDSKSPQIASRLLSDGQPLIANIHKRHSATPQSSGGSASAPWRWQPCTDNGHPKSKSLAIFESLIAIYIVFESRNPS